MPLGFPSSRRPGTGGGENAGGTGTTVGFGTVAAAAAFAFTLHIASKLRSPLGLSHYKSAVDEDGTVSDFETLLQRVAEKGLEPDARPEVWPLLLGVYRAGETYEHRSASYKRLREAFEGLLRRCQALEAACLEATSFSRRSARASSSCCGPPLQSPSNTTSASASPLYFSKSPAITGRDLGTSSGGGAIAGAAGDSRCCAELLRPAPTAMQIQMSCMDDGSWGKVVEAADDTAAAVAVTDGNWEEDGLEGGDGAAAAAALTPASEASFLGHVSRTDMPPELRPYWEAQHSIALDAVRVDFKKSQLPGATPLAAAATSSGSGGVSGLTVSLRGLGFTGLASGGAATPAAIPVASGLPPAAAAPTLSSLSNDSCDATGDIAAPAQTLNPSAASGGGGSSSRFTSWFREKVEEYHASRAARHHQQQQQQQPRQSQARGQEQQQELELSDVPPTQPAAQLASAPQPAATKCSLLQMQEAVALRLTEVLELPGQLQHGRGVSEPFLPEQLVSEPVDGSGETLWGSPLEAGLGSMGRRSSNSDSKNNCSVLSAAQNTDANTVAAAAVGAGAATVADNSSEVQNLPPVLRKTSADVCSSVVPATSCEGEIECARRGGGAAAPAIIDNGAGDAQSAAVYGMSSESPISVAARVCAADADDRGDGVASAACPDPRVGGLGFASRWAAFSNRIRPRASVPTLTPPRLTLELPSSASASCPSSPLLQNDAPTGHGTGTGGACVDQHSDVCTPVTSSLPSVTSTPRYASEGGISRGFAAIHAAAAGSGAGGGGGCSGSTVPAPSSSWPYVSALARFHLDHVTHFTEGQMRVVERLVMLLSAYAVHDPALGYCQGMSDLALPFVLLLEDDVMAFWCFVRFMGKVRANFLPRSDGVFEHLATLGLLLTALDPQLGAHLTALHADHCHFAHRMVAVQMRRELSAELAVRLWEQLWADDLLEASAQQRLVRCNTTDQSHVAAEAGAVELSNLGGCPLTVWRLGRTSWRQTVCHDGLGEREEGNAGEDEQRNAGEEDVGPVVRRMGGAGNRGFERESDAAVESDKVMGFARDVPGGPFGGGGVAAASAALRSSCESLGGLGPGASAADAAAAGECDALAAPSEDAFAPAGMTCASVGANGTAAEAAFASSVQVSVTDMAAYGSLQGRAAAASYSEGFANRSPPAAAVASAAAAEVLSAGGLASALSCDGAEVGAGTCITAPAESAVMIGCSGDDAATNDVGGNGGGKTEGSQPAACCSSNPGADGNDLAEANGGPPLAEIGSATRVAAALEDATVVVASAAAVTAPDPLEMAPVCGGGDVAAASAVAAAPPPPMGFGRELFLYLVASLVLSQRRKMLECKELDDVLRLFQSLPPMNRSDVNDALCRAREFRGKVAQRPPLPPAPALVESMPTVIVASTPTPTPAAPPPPPPSSERTWLGLMSFRSDPPKAKL